MRDEAISLNNRNEREREKNVSNMPYFHLLGRGFLMYTNMYNMHLYIYMHRTIHTMTPPFFPSILFIHQHPYIRHGREFRAKKKCIHNLAGQG